MGCQWKRQARWEFWKKNPFWPHSAPGAPGTSQKLTFPTKRNLANGVSTEASAQARWEFWKKSVSTSTGPRGPCHGILAEFISNVYVLHVAHVPFLKPLYLRRYSTYRGLPGAKLTYSLWRFQGNLLIGASCSGSIDMSTEPTDPCIYVCSVLMFYVVQLRERSLLFKVRQLHFYVISAHCNVRNYLGEAN